MTGVAFFIPVQGKLQGRGEGGRDWQQAGGQLEGLGGGVATIRINGGQIGLLIELLRVGHVNVSTVLHIIKRSGSPSKPTLEVVIQKSDLQHVSLLELSHSEVVDQHRAIHLVLAPRPRQVQANRLGQALQLLNHLGRNNIEIRIY